MRNENHTTSFSRKELIIIQRVFSISRQMHFVLLQARATSPDLFPVQLVSIIVIILLLFLIKRGQLMQTDSASNPN